MKLDALDHPKTLDFAARLNVPLPQAIGHLELLWAFVGQKTPQGNIGKWPNGAIARAAYWNDDPDEFVNAAISAGFMEHSERHRIVIHDWHEHMPRWVKAKLSKAGLSAVTPEPNGSRETPKTPHVDGSGDCSNGDSSDVSNGDSSDCSGYSVREGKGSEGKTPHIPPQPKAPDRKVNFETFLQNCEQEGVQPIPPDDPIFEYAKDAKVPKEYLRLCWLEFHDKHLAKPRKTYVGIKGWRAAFRNCVRENWYRLWYFSSEGECCLGSNGQQAQNAQSDAA